MSGMSIIGLIVVCLVGIVVSQFVPNSWKYVFGFVVGQATLTVMKLLE